MGISRKKTSAKQNRQKNIPSPSSKKKNPPSREKKNSVQHMSQKKQTSHSKKVSLPSSKKSKNTMTKIQSTEETQVPNSPKSKKTKAKKIETTTPKSGTSISQTEPQKKTKKVKTLSPTKKDLPEEEATPKIEETVEKTLEKTLKEEAPKKVAKKKKKKPKANTPHVAKNESSPTANEENTPTSEELDPKKEATKENKKSLKEKRKSEKNPRISKTAEEARKTSDSKESSISIELSEKLPPTKKSSKKKVVISKKTIAEEIVTKKIKRKLEEKKKEAETKRSKKTSFTAFSTTYYDSSEPLYRKPKRTINEFTSFPSDELFKAYQRKMRLQVKEQKNPIEFEEEILDPQYPHLRKNEAIPNFLLSDLSYGIHNLKELQSKKVILFHWSSWDKRCREALLHWYRFWVQRKNEFALVTIAQDQNPMMVQAFRDYHQLYGQECYFLIDRDASIEDYFPLYDLPRVHLVNEFGIISGAVHDPSQPTDHLEGFLRTRPLEDLPKLAANIPTIRDMKRKMEEAQEETIDNKFDLAHGYFLNGKGRVSAAILEEIIELQPENAKAHFRRGVILWELGMNERSMEHLNKARDLDKNNELYKKRIQVLEKPELFYSREQLNYKPPSSNTGVE